MDPRYDFPAFASSSLSSSAPMAALGSYPPPMPYPPAPDAYPPEPLPLERKRSLGDTDAGRVKKTRQTPCRARKVKCDRLPPGFEPAGGAQNQDSCTHCRSMAMPCTFDYKPKKRGPPNLYVKRMQERSANGSSLNTVDVVHAGPPLNRSVSARSAAGDPTYDGSVPSFAYPAPPFVPEPGASNGDRFAPPPLGGPAVPFPADWSASPATSSSGVSPDYLATPFSVGAGGASVPMPSAQPPQLGATPPTASFSPGYSPVQAFNQAPRPGNPLDALIPRPLLTHIIQLYFDYIWCLIPCVHRPTFMRDFDARREELPDQEDWVAFVLAIVGSTLAQMPSSFVPLDRPRVKALIQMCLEFDLRRVLLPPHSMTERLCTLYMLEAIPYTQGNLFSRDLLHGIGHALANRLRLQDERSYENLDPIETEVRRRLFWLLYGGDRTIACCDSHGLFWSEVDIDVGLPRMIDDDFITATGYLEPPPTYGTPMVAGFIYISKLFALLGEALEMRRRDQKKLPTGLLLQMRINEVDSLFDQVMTFMDDCPEPLKLDMTGTPGERMQSLQEDWDAVATADVKQILAESQTSRRHHSVKKDAFLVQQANIYVTQQLVRYMIIQYRDELGALQDRELQDGAGGGPHSSGFARGLFGPRRGLNRVAFTEKEKDQVASDLLAILGRISIQIIAINSHSLISKIRLVASTLLDALKTSPTATNLPSVEDDRAVERTAKAQGYLWDFLRILSEIEAAYTLEDHAAGPVV